jgi:hypothetical protein
MLDRAARREEGKEHEEQSEQHAQAHRAIVRSFAASAEKVTLRTVFDRDTDGKSARMV